MASAACCTPAPPAEHIDQGKLGTIGGLPAYLNNTSSKTAIIFAPDAFGVDSPLLRKLADKTAAAGFYAVVPDYFRGEAYVPKDPAAPFAHFRPWLASHHPDASIDDSKKVIKDLKAQGVEKIGISGFCWGGRLAIMTANAGDLVQAVVLLHPSLTTIENITDVKVATAILGCEFDEATPPSLALQFEQILDKKPFPSLVKIFPGQTHGWSIRYDVNDPHQVKGAEESHSDMLDFYKKVLL